MMPTELDSEHMIAGKTHSEILLMTTSTRCRWYKTILPEEKEEAMSLVETVRRAKMSMANIGEKNPMFGKTRPKESRVKQSESWTLEKRAKQSAAKMGCIPSKETRDKMSAAKMGKNNPMYGESTSEETKAKQRAAKIGKPLTEEHKINIGKASMERWKDPEYRVKMNTRNVNMMGEKNHMNQPEHRARMHDVMTGKNNPMYGRTGENHPNWQGGISTLPYGPEFNSSLKSQIRERDNHTCQECQQSEDQLGYPLCVHHIDYDKKNNAQENLISLCRSCHSQTNFGREDWAEYFRGMMEEGAGG